GAKCRTKWQFERAQQCDREHGWWRHIPKRHSLQRLCRICAGRHQGKSTPDDQCGPPIRDIRSAYRDSRTIDKLQCRRGNRRCSSEWNLQRIYRAVELSGRDTRRRGEDAVCGFLDDAVWGCFTTSGLCMAGCKYADCRTSRRLWVLFRPALRYSGLTNRVATALRYSSNPL